MASICVESMVQERIVEINGREEQSNGQKSFISSMIDSVLEEELVEDEFIDIPISTEEEQEEGIVRLIHCPSPSLHTAIDDEDEEEEILEKKKKKTFIRRFIRSLRPSKLGKRLFPNGVSCWGKRGKMEIEVEGGEEKEEEEDEGIEMKLIHPPSTSIHL